MPLSEPRIRTTISRARRATNAAMLDRCIVLDASTVGALDPDTGRYDTNAGEVVYEGRCRIQPRGTQTQPRSREDQATTTAEYELVVPHDAGPFAEGQVVTLTKSADGNAVAHAWRLGPVPTTTNRVDQRIPVEEVTPRG